MTIKNLKLWWKVFKIRKDIHKFVLPQSSEKIYVDYFGVYQLNPKHLVFIIETKTDKEKELLRNKVSAEILRKILIDHEYPKEAVNLVQFAFESQETVQRESNGNWFEHFK